MSLAADADIGILDRCRNNRSDLCSDTVEESGAVIDKARVESGMSCHYDASMPARPAS